MSSITKKKILLVILFTASLTICIFLGFLFFINSADADMERIPHILYFDNPASETIHFNFVTSNQLYHYFKESFFQYLPLLIASICFLILLFSIILLYGMQRLDKKHHEEIAHDLEDVTQGVMPKVTVNLLEKEYQNINRKLLAFEQDQQRLHSYISHEQKNLITLIKGRAEKINNSLLMEDIDKLSQSVDDILALSANQDSPKTICDLALIVAEEYDLYRAIYPHLHFTFEEDKEYMVLGKEQWLRRALDNLIENAIKYGNQKDIEISLRQKYNSVLLYVKDYGKGMSEEEQYNIFDYGYQIHELKKDGYGIGLSIVCHVCDLCDGFIHVKSEPQKGSLFILSFPLSTV